MNLQFFAAAAASSLFAGCAPISVTDVASTYYQLPATTTVIVRQTITIPPGAAHVTLQDGRIVAIDHLRRYEPFCQFEVNDVVETEQQVRPGRFAAARIIRQQKLYGEERQPLLLAANTVTGSQNDAGIGTVLRADNGYDASFCSTKSAFDCSPPSNRMCASCAVREDGTSRRPWPIRHSPR
ncbi:MAG: hypothetical protein IPK39_15325 [Sulfuritalea sp.]|nr:hypothetical protein [Sulfuritalea sp.]